MVGKKKVTNADEKKVTPYSIRESGFSTLFRESMLSLFRKTAPSLMKTGMAKILSSQIFLIKGKQKYHDSNLTTLFIGDEIGAYYFAYLAYFGNPDVQEIGKTTLSQIDSKVASTPQADIVFIQADKLFLEFLRQKEFFIMPKVNFVLDLSGSLDEFYNRLNRRRRRDIEKVIKVGYTFETTKEDNKLDFFYHRMYLPFTAKRHRESTLCENLANLKPLYRKGGLLLVKQNEKYVSGILYRLDGKTVKTPCFGILEGRDELIRDGAGQATLYFLIQWCKKHNYETLDYGPARPFLRDGIFVYKKEWGMKAKELKEQSIYAFSACNFERGVRDFLADNPFIFTHQNSLKGLLFVDKDTLEIEEVQELFNAHFTPHLSSLIIICPGEVHSLGKQDLTEASKEETISVDNLRIKRLKDNELPDALRQITKLAKKTGCKIHAYEVMQLYL